MDLWPASRFSSHNMFVTLLVSSFFLKSEILSTKGFSDTQPVKVESFSVESSLV